MHFAGDVHTGKPVFYVSSDCVAVLHRAVVDGQLGDVRIESVERVQVPPAPANPPTMPTGARTASA